MNLREKFIDLEMRRVVDVARDRFVVGITGVLALGFLEGGLLVQSTEAHTRGLARADAQAAAASGSARLRKLAAKGMEADLAATGSLKHRMGDFLALRLVVPGRYAVAQLVPSLLGAVSYVDTRSQAAANTLTKIPASMLRHRWLGALRCAVGFVTSLSTLYPLLDAYAVGARRYANDRAAARIPPAHIARVGNNEPLDACVVLESVLSRLKKLPQLSEAIVGGGLNGPSVASAPQAPSQSSTASSSNGQKGLVLRLCGERALQGLLVHHAATVAKDAVARETSLREGLHLEQTSINGSALKTSGKRHLMSSGDATLLPVVLAPRPLNPHFPTDVLHAALYEPTVASAAIYMPPLIDPSKWPQAMADNLYRVFGVTTGKHKPANAASAYDAAYASTLQATSADPPFWRLENVVGEKNAATAERAGAAAAALGLNSELQALTLPALPLNLPALQIHSPSSSGEASAEGSLDQKHKEGQEPTASLQTAAGTIGKRLSKALWSDTVQMPLVLVLEADITTTDGRLGRPYGKGSSSNQGAGWDLDVKTALAAFEGATNYIAAAAASTSSPSFASFNTLWNSFTNGSSNINSKASSRSSAPEKGWALANGIRVRMRRVLLVDDKQSFMNALRKRPETVRSSAANVTRKAASVATRSAGIDKAMKKDEEIDEKIVVVSSNDVILRAIVQWARDQSEPEELDHEVSRDLFERIGHWVLWPFIRTATASPAKGSPGSRPLLVDTDSEEFFARVSSVLAPYGWQVLTPKHWTSSSPPSEPKLSLSANNKSSNPLKQFPPLFVHHTAGDEMTAEICAIALKARRDDQTSHGGSICALTLHQPSLLPFELKPDSRSIQNRGEITQAVVSATAAGETPRPEEDFSLHFLGPRSAHRNNLSVVCVTELQNNALAYTRELLISGCSPRKVQEKLDAAISLSVGPLTDAGLKKK